MRAAFLTSFFALTTSIALAAPVSIKEKVHMESRGDDGAHITWYSGKSLDDPYCGGPTPSDSDLVAATPWDSPYDCGDKVQFDYWGNKVTVTIVDKCDTCSGTWFDLAKGAFSHLADLEVGELHNVDFWRA